MNLLQKLKRFEVKKLFVCIIYVAHNIHSDDYYGIPIYSQTLWTPHFLGVRILYGDDKILTDPVYKNDYISKNMISVHNPEKNMYYQRISNLADFPGIDIANVRSISLKTIIQIDSFFKELSKNITRKIAT